MEEGEEKLDTNEFNCQVGPIRLGFGTGHRKSYAVRRTQWQRPLRDSCQGECNPKDKRVTFVHDRRRHHNGKKQP